MHDCDGTSSSSVMVLPLLDQNMVHVSTVMMQRIVIRPKCGTCQHCYDTDTTRSYCSTVSVSGIMLFIVNSVKFCGSTSVFILNLARFMER